MNGLEPLSGIVFLFFFVVFFFVDKESLLFLDYYLFDISWLVGWLSG